jgi:hypothetical protein
VACLSNFGKSNYYVLILVLSTIGSLLFIFTEFGGYTSYYSYSVNIESVFSNPDLIAYAPIYLLVAFLFLVNVFISLKELNILKLSFPHNSAKLGYYTSIAIFVITVISGITFVALLSEANDWWFGAGFYAGILGGILLPLLYRLSRKSTVSSLDQTTYTIPPPPPPPA